MNNEIFSKGPWKQGQVLLTPETRTWSEDQLRVSNEHEARFVFSNFNDVDLGKSRRAVAQFARHEDAALAALTPELVDAFVKTVRIIANEMSEAYLDRDVMNMISKLKELKAVDDDVLYKDY